MGVLLQGFYLVESTRGTGISRCLLNNLQQGWTIGLWDWRQQRMLVNSIMRSTLD